ncbi:MAG: preprotein translocase subunit YajC [Catenulispora sp. 13_1_20CM_3_70_7]|jgi:preprotein translocase subunit YajC|nr:preprotein translocase subunit YajC [Catenulisporales bacterium]OLE27100.1 MAG: preprotein translocase subunit YajC [Catenulispora sp. 13_1_20CM_3_70_7]
MGSPVFLIWIVLIGFMFYFMMIRPQKRARQQQADTLNHLQPGAQVRTTAQIYGTVVEVGDDWAIVETTPGTRIKFGKPAIIGIVLPEDAEEGEDAPTPGGIGDEPSAAAEGDAEPSAVRDAVPATETQAADQIEKAEEAEAKTEAKAEEAEPVAKS